MTMGDTRVLMTRKLLAGSFAALLALAAASAQEARKPSTPEERARAVQVAKALELDPLGDGVKSGREWALRWLIEVPDVSVKLCGSLLGPVLGSRKNYSTEIFTQVMLSTAAFVIENPDKANDDVAAYTAGVEGALRAYESILKVKPKARWPFLDDLIVKRSEGELADYVREAAKHCK
jgi:carboxypeptidase Q